MFNIQEFEVELWKKALKEADKVVSQLQEEVDNDPLRELLDINIEFSELLENNKGLARLEKSFNQRVNELHKREKAAKIRAKSFNILETCDALSEAKLKHNAIDNKYRDLIYYNSLRKQRTDSEKA